MISSGVGFHLLREVGGPIVRPYMEAKFKDSCCIIIYTHYVNSIIALVKYC